MFPVTCSVLHKVLCTRLIELISEVSQLGNVSDVTTEELLDSEWLGAVLITYGII